MSKLKITDFPFPKKGWQIDRLGQHPNGLWFCTACYGFSPMEPGPDWQFQVTGCKTREEAIGQIRKLVKKEIAKGKWTEIAQ